MKVIYKYGPNDTHLPASAEPLAFQIQDGVPTVWALVECDDNSKARPVTVIGTGFARDYLRKSDYIGTVQDDSGFVWHAFIGSAA